MLLHAGRAVGRACVPLPSGARRPFCSCSSSLPRLQRLHARRPYTPHSTTLHTTKSAATSMPGGQHAFQWGHASSVWAHALNMCQRTKRRARPTPCSFLGGG